MNNLINNGIYVLNNNISDKEKTIIILGSPRSGTSMIGKVLYELGVIKDNDLDKNVYEDRKIIEILENSNNENEIESFFRNQNLKYDIWGFKRPGAYFYIKKYEKFIKNPVYIIPFKDMLSISLRKNISIGQDFKKSLKETLEHHNKLIEFILSNENPIVLFSYEKALLNPENFVSSLIKILKISPSSEQIKKAINAIEINPKDYLQNSRVITYGVVENFQDGVVSGWAKSSINNEPVDIYIYVNDKEVKKGKANIFRKDLKESNIGNGSHGFAISLNDISLNKGDVINIYGGIHKDELKNSPILIQE